MDFEGNSLDAAAGCQRSKKNKIGYRVQGLKDGGLPNLPDEIVVEILAKLPARALLRFRSVSKSWFSIISSGQFVKTHLNSSIRDRNLSNHRILATISNPNFDLKQFSVRSLVSEPSTDAYSIDYPRKHPRRAVWVVGSCNGLICMALNEKDLFLWNPCTRKSNRLPAVDVSTKRGFYNIYGFGFNEADDDYKVVGIFYLFGNGIVLNPEVMVQIYSSNTNSWKKMEGFMGGIPIDESGKFASGKLHWSASSNLGSDFRWDIMSIDLENEVYGMVDQPTYVGGDFDSTLGVLDGRLCILRNYQKICADVWVLKEYDVPESWTKVVTIPYEDYSERVLYSKPMCTLPNDMYVESLVLPFANGRKG